MIECLTFGGSLQAAGAAASDDGKRLEQYWSGRPHTFARRFSEGPLTVVTLERDSGGATSGEHWKRGGNLLAYSGIGEDVEVVRERLAALDRNPAELFPDHALYLWWRTAECRLVVGTDGLGLRTLHYALDDERLIFAEELGALLALLRTPRPLDAAALAEFLALGREPRGPSLVAGVDELAHGGSIECRPNQFIVNRCRPYFGHVTPFASSSEALASIDQRLDEALERCADAAEIGVAFSGGIDSTLIASYLADKRDVNLFTVVSADPDDPNREAARAVATALHATHHEVLLAPPTVEEAIGLLGRVIDRPAADPIVFHNAALAAQAGEAVGVLLNGLVDDLFAARGRQRRAMLLPTSASAGLAETWPIAALPGYPDFERWDELRWALRLNYELPEVLAPEVICAAGEVAVERQIAAAANVGGDPGASTTNSVLGIDTFLLSWYENVILPRELGLSAGFAVRTPFLDRRLLDLVFGLPPGLRLWGGARKGPLRRRVRALIPEHLINRKAGFDSAFEPHLWFEANGAAVDEFSSRVLGTLLREGATAAPGLHPMLRWRLFSLAVWLDSRRDSLLLEVSERREPIRFLLATPAGAAEAISAGGGS